MRYLAMLTLLLCCSACTADSRQALVPDLRNVTGQVHESRQVWHEATGHTLDAPTSAIY